MFPPGMSISDRQAQELANYIRVYGSNLLKHARKIFLWENLTNSTLVNIEYLDFKLKNMFLFIFDDSLALFYLLSSILVYQ